MTLTPVSSDERRKRAFYPSWPRGVSLASLASPCVLPCARPIQTTADTLSAALQGALGIDANGDDEAVS